MEALQQFNFKGKEVRVLMGETRDPWFVAFDVTSILGYANGRDAISKHCKSDGVAKRDIIDSMGRTQAASVINEPNLYRLIIKSPKPEAEPFERWVFEEVLPSIRKHGAYLTPQRTEELINNPDLIIQLATFLKLERKRSSQLLERNVQLEEKATFIDQILDSDEGTDIGQAAKLLALPYGRNTLFGKLREKGVLFKDRNEPKQEYIDRGYFQVKEKWIERHSHEGFLVMKTIVTQKGLAYISKLLAAEIPTRVQTN